MKCKPEKVMEALIVSDACTDYKCCSFENWTECEDTDKSWNDYFEDKTCKSCRLNPRINCET